ncbi:MAG: hypothetical protein KF852_00820 [Saprospiraceae bacterium]|nr:hypothetical protein [Saprospiraceae bacterium]
MPADNHSAPYVYHLGITMAGAVSAGSYTGGVMDYLIRCLQRWEQAKRGEYLPQFRHLIPPHQVVIDAIGGASAGGMTTTMTVLTLLRGDYKPIDPKEIAGIKTPTGNLFYDSWIGLNDTLTDGTTLMQMLKDEDLLGQEGKFLSLFNSNPIDAIAGKAFDIDGDIEELKKNLPPFIAPDLEVILTLTSLRGIPVHVDFNYFAVRRQTQLATNSPAPAHRMQQHRIVAHFKLNYRESADKNRYLHFDPTDPQKAALIKAVTIGSGAFPVGLRSRWFTLDQIPVEYIRQSTLRQLQRNIDESKPDFQMDLDKLLPDFKNLESFEFTAVDGGTLNNEPFGEVVQILEEKKNAKGEDLIHIDPPNFTIIMIDPFPSFEEQMEEGKNYDEVHRIVTPLVDAMRQQAMFKPLPSLKKYASDYPRTLVYPTRYTVEPQAGNPKDLGFKRRGEKDKAPICCASMHAFGGFLSEDFRKHDFALGQINCRNFLRAVLSFEYNPPHICHPMHQGWTPEMVEAFKVVIKGKTYLPVIPDVDWLTERDNLHPDYPYDYFMDKPKLDAANLEPLRRPIKNRAHNLLNKVESLTNKKSGKKIVIPGVAGWWKQRKSKAKSWVMRRLFRLLKKCIAGEMTKIALQFIANDLEERGLLKNKDER